MVWPRLPAMPEVEASEMKRGEAPSFPSRASSTKRAFMVSGAIRFTAIRSFHFSGAMFASNLSRRIPALWITMSSPPWRSVA